MNKKYLVEPGIDSQQVIQLLEDKIYEHNSTKLNKVDGNLFSKIVRDKNGDIIAGIAGWTWASACEITQLWVREDARNNRIGKMLLEEAEAEAKSKGCSNILVRSYSFQSPRFYERHEYKIEHIINGFPDGHSYYFLTKRIG